MLVFGFGLAVVAVIAYAFFLKALHNKKGKKKNNLIMQISGGIFIFSIFNANQIYQILEVEALPLLQGFGCWYWLGFVAQLPLLLFRREPLLDFLIFSKISYAPSSALSSCSSPSGVYVSSSHGDVEIIRVSTKPPQGRLFLYGIFTVLFM